MDDLHVIAVCIFALTVLTGLGAVMGCCRWCRSNPFPPSFSSVQAKDSRSVRETIKNIEGASAQ
uniref:UF protein n=1 Tax=Barley yellow dwarf virus (isolate PAV) TaxID=2169986 RepID=Q5CC78_BYDVP|nr:UF protein [Barley yellow dwarf virus PAV]